MLKDILFYLIIFKNIIMPESMMNIKRYLRLNFILAFVDFKLKNEGSYLGLFWYLLNPLLMFIAILAIFSDRLGSGIPNYPIYLIVGIIMFNFFRQTTIDSTKCLTDNNKLLKNINLSHKLLVSSTILKNIFSHIIEIILVMFLLYIFGVPLLGILFYPLILIFFCVFIYGVSLTFAAITVYFLDLEKIWLFLSFLLWIVTPIFYDIGGQTKLLIFNLFNPLYYFITITRDIVVYTKVPEPWMVLMMIFYSFLALMIGDILFNLLKDKFNELM